MLYKRVHESRKESAIGVPLAKHNAFVK